MSTVYRSSGASMLAEACRETLLNPNFAFGLVDVEGIAGKGAEEIGDYLQLHVVTDELNRAWKRNGFLGTVGAFEFMRTSHEPSSPHIDQKKGTGARSLQRVAVLSIARHGVGRIRGKQFDAALLPGEERTNLPTLDRMRSQARELGPRDLPIDFRHHPSQVLIIPTLPTPTAHMVEIATEARATDLWDCVHTP